MEFLKSIDLDAVLQQLVRDALDAKPDDALAFAADWTRKKLELRNKAAAQHQSSGTDDSSARGGNSPLQSSPSGNSDPGLGAGGRRSSEHVLKSHSISINSKSDEVDVDLDVNDSASVVHYSWRMRTLDEDENFVLNFCDLILTVLFTSHPLLQKMITENLDVNENEMAENLAVFVNQIIHRKSTPAQIAKAVMKKWSSFAPAMSAKSGILLRFRQRHFHYLLCSVLFAAECIFTRSSWKQLGNDWLQVFGDVVQQVQAAVFDEQIVTASLVSRESLDSEFEQRMHLTTASLTQLGPVDTAKGVWLGMSSSQQEKICKKFFAVLFTQHKTVIRFFVDEDKESKEGDSLVDHAPSKELQVILTQVLRGFLSLEAISKMAARYSTKETVPQRYLHYALSCMLTALSIELGPKKMDTQISQAWRIVLTRILDAVAEGLNGAQDDNNNKKDSGDNSSNNNDKDGNTSSPAAAASSSSSCSKNSAEGSSVSQQVDSSLKMRIDDPPKLDQFNSGSPFTTAAECWTAMRDRQSAAEIAETFFNILFTQHPALAKNLVKNNAELSEVMAFLPSLFTDVVNSEMSESDLREMGAKLTGRGLDEQKAEHGVCAAMSVFAITLGINVFRERESDLNVVVRFIMDNILFGIQNAQAVLAARAPEVIVEECWHALTAKDTVIKKALEVMKIQHRGLTRDLLDGLDIDEFATQCSGIVSKLLKGELSDEEMSLIIGKLKAKCEEKQRPLDKKFITYFAFSFQSAVSIVLGSSRYETVAQHWTGQIDKASKKFAELI